jgi:hypothetical protein
MKKPIVFFAIIIVLICLITSCKIPLYVPVNEVVNSVNKKNELVVAASFYSLQVPRGQVSLSYSPIKHLGVAANRFIGAGQFTTSAAIGFYSNKIGDASKFKFYDIYLGMSRGRNVAYGAERNQFSPINEYQNKLTGYYNKFFIQSGLHSKNNRFFSDIYFHANVIDWSYLLVETNSSVVFPDLDMLREKDISLNAGFGANFGFDTQLFKIFAGANIGIPFYNTVKVYDPVSISSGVAFKLF